VALVSPEFTQNSESDFMIFRMLTLLTLVVIATAGLAEAQGFNSDANNDNELKLPPQVDPDADSPTNLQEGEFDDLPGADIDEDEDAEPYYFPQPHMFERPLNVGADQLQHYRGYWQPGGYDQRAGSPFFNSVPNAPPRGPLAGNGPSGYGNNSGMNGNAMQGYYGGGNMNGSYSGMNGYAGNNGYNGYNQYNYNYAGSAYGSNYGSNYSGGAGAGGAGGDPMSYHFGPGYYRSGEYGHFRFPYYSYRRPWYHPGFAGYNRDTNLPW